MREAQCQLSKLLMVSSWGGRNRRVFRAAFGGWANTISHAGKMIVTIFAGSAEFECGLIRVSRCPLLVEFALATLKIALNGWN